MKINNTGMKPTTAAQIKARDLESKLTNTVKPGDAKAGDASSIGSSKIDLSPEAQAYQKAKALASNDDIDEAKVSRLQKLIDEGKYNVNAEAVADRLVDEQILAGE
ncbi:MAG: flagellar biosynthesis anti-sigma factor FlgM [Bdellovibrionales bacterium]